MLGSGGWLLASRRWVVARLGRAPTDGFFESELGVGLSAMEADRRLPICSVGRVEWRLGGMFGHLTGRPQDDIGCRMFGLALVELFQSEAFDFC